MLERDVALAYPIPATFDLTVCCQALFNVVMVASALETALEHLAVGLDTGTTKRGLVAQEEFGSFDQ